MALIFLLAMNLSEGSERSDLVSYLSAWRAGEVESCLMPSLGTAASSWRPCSALQQGPCSALLRDSILWLVQNTNYVI